MNLIDLSKHVTATRARGGWYASPSVLAVTGYDKGQKLARELNVKDMQGEKIHVEVPYELDHAEVKFLSGLFRTLIRRQGIDKTEELVSTNTDKMDASLKEFWNEERAKEAKKKAEKERKESLGQWADPMQFFVPDIGTRVRLKKDWTFRLHSEGRNYDLFKMLGLDYGNARYGNWKPKREITEHELTFKAGTILKIDRVYIRKGVKEYSSITFNVEKGKDSVAVAGKVEHTFKKRGARFWAKLSDVNRMVVEVDKSTLAEN